MFDHLKPGMLVQDGRDVYKISTLYPDRVTAQLLLPLPDRTTVRTFSADAVNLRFRFPTQATVDRVRAAYLRSA